MVISFTYVIIYNFDQTKLQTSLTIYMKYKTIQETFYYNFHVNVHIINQKKNVRYPPPPIISLYCM